MTNRKSKSKAKAQPPVPVGVVGLGLMGTSITTCLLAAGHPVVGIDKDAAKRRNARKHALALLREMRREKLLAKDPASLAGNLTVTGDFTALGTSALVIECIFEDLAAKREVLRQ